MKTWIAPVAAMIVLLVSCGTPKPEGFTEIKTPFSGSRYESNASWFRGTGSGESPDLETSGEKARLMARQRIAADIQAQVRKVSESYAGDRQASGITGDFSARFQNLTREVVNQTLTDVRTIDEKRYLTKNRTYVTYSAMECKKKDVYSRLKELSAAQNSLSASEKDAIGKMIDEAIRDSER